MTKLTNRQIVALEFAYYRRNRAIKSGEKKAGYATCSELRRMGYLAKQYENSDFYYITPVGLAYLESEYPMVDQPQPAPEVEPLKVKQLTDSRKRALKWINTRIVKHGECHIYVAQKHGLKLTTLNKLMDLGFIEYDGHKIVLTDAALPYLE